MNLAAGLNLRTPVNMTGIPVSGVGTTSGEVQTVPGYRQGIE